MPTFNKETKNKASMLMMQLFTDHRVIVVKTSSYLDVKEAFRRRFSEKDPPTNRKIWKNVKITKTKESINKSKHQ